MKIIKKIFELLNKIPTYMIIAITVFIFCLVFTYIGFQFYHINLINGDQLGYMGAIFGGGITLLGIYLTIHHENLIRKQEQQQRDKERKEDLVIQYQPVLDMIDEALFILSNQGSEIRIHESKLINILEYTNNEIRMKSDIKIKNVGRGEAKNVSISSSFSTNDLNQNDSIELTPKFIDIIPMGRNIQVSSLLCFKNIFKDTKKVNGIQTCNIKKMNVEYVLTYTDLYTLKNFKSVFYCEYTFKIINERIHITNKSYKNTFEKATKG